MPADSWLAIYAVLPPGPGEPEPTFLGLLELEDDVMTSKAVSLPMSSDGGMNRTLLVLGSTVLASTAAAQAPLGESSSSTDTTSTDTAVSAQPQISGLRSGTIGIPSEGAADGLQALLSNQISRKGVDIDAFAKLGGLSFTDKIAVEILGETFTASVPRTLIDGMVALPRMLSTTISDVGFRLRIRLSSGAPGGLTMREHRAQTYFPSIATSVLVSSTRVACSRPPLAGPSRSVLASSVARPPRPMEPTPKVSRGISRSSTSR